MREIMKLGLRLFLFSLIAAIALAATNEVTKGPIARQAEQQAVAARMEVLPSAENYEEIPFEPDAQYSGIESIYRVMRDDDMIGYAFMVTTPGYKGPIVMTLALNESGSINAVSINSQSETAGLGSHVAEEPFLSQFSGKAADPDTILSEVDTITGATISSQAVISGVEQALLFAHNVLKLDGHAGEVITKESVSQYAVLESATGTKDIKPISVFESLGFADIKTLYQANHQGQKAFVFVLSDGTSVVLGADGAVLGGGGDSASPSVYYQKFLKGGAAK